MNRKLCFLCTLANLILFFHPGSSDAADFSYPHWQGFFIGVNAGVGFGGNSKSLDIEGFNYPCPTKPNCTQVPGEVTKVGMDTAFIGGVQIGYNHQFNRWILGVEGDFSWFDLEASKIPASSKADWGSDTLVSVEMNWLATVRGRLGYTMDKWLIYATGGAAFNDGIYRNHDFCKDTTIGCGSGLLDAKGSMDVGWTVGGGVEYAYLKNWTVKAEYLFVEFPGEEYAGTAIYPSTRDPQTEVYHFSASPSEFNLLRLGLNYKFDAP